MSEHEPISLSDETRAQLARLAAIYGSASAVIAEAVRRLALEIDPPPEPPHVVGWEPVVLAAPAVCAETGRPLAARTTAYREIWSDGRPGAILSREALVEDHVLDEW